MRHILLLAAAAAVSFAAGCTGVENLPPVAVTVAAFDPDPLSPTADQPIAPLVPTPNDLLRDPATGLLALPTLLFLRVAGLSERMMVPAFSSESAAQLAESYLNTLTGYPVDASLVAHFQGAPPVAESLTPDSLFVLDMTDALAGSGPPVRVEGIIPALGGHDPERNLTPLQLLLPPGQRYQQGHTYTAVITDGVTDAAGQPVASSYLFNFLKTTTPLIDESGRSRCALPDSAAAQLEPIRRDLIAPLLDLLASPQAGEEQLDRSEIALLWRFTIRREATALYDPTAGVLPTPNFALMTSAAGSNHDCDGDGKADCQPGRLCFPLDCAGDSPAQLAFFSYMNSLDGWPASLVPTLSFSQPLAPESVTGEAVALYLFEGGQPRSLSVTPRLDATARRLELRPGEPVLPAARYAAFVTTGLLTADNGLPVRPDTLMAVAKLTLPLVVEGRSQLTDFGLDDAQAQLLEPLRQATAELLATIGMESSRPNLAALWEYTVHSHNEALFDPTRALLPTPNELLMTLDSNLKPLRLNLPSRPDWPAGMQEMAQAANSLDGFSTTGSATVPFLRPLDSASLAWLPSLTGIVGKGLDEKSSLAMADITLADPAAGIGGLTSLLDDANIYAGDRMTAGWDDQQRALVISPRPGHPLPAGRRFMALALDNLASLEEDADKEPYPIEPAPVFFLARNPHPLFDQESGTSTVATLSNEEAGQLEALRSQYDPVLAALASDVIMVPRERVLMLWTFTTQTIGEWLIERRKEIVTAGISISDSPGQLKEVEFSGLELKNAGRVVTNGRFTGRSGLDPVDPAANPPATGRMRFNPDGSVDWQPEEIPFTLLLPSESVAAVPPYPVVLMVPGLGQSRTATLSQADLFLAAGYAVVALDLPCHGTRTPAGATALEAFFPADVIAIRDHLVQATLEVAQTIFFITADKQGLAQWLEGELGEEVIDPTAIYLVAESLGAVAATAAIPLVDRVARAALISPWGRWRTLFDLPESPLGKLLGAALTGAGADSGESLRREFVELAQLLLDRADPVNYARHLLAAPFGSAVPVPTFFVLAGDDQTVPSSAGLELACVARAEEGPELKSYTGAGHGFFFAQAAGEPPAGAAKKAAAEVLSFFAGEAVPGGLSGETLGCEAL